MKFTISLNGVRVDSKEIPIRWQEVTFRQSLELIKAGKDLIKKASIFTGIDVDTLRKSEIENMDGLLSVLSFTDKPIPLDLPETVLGYPIVKDLESKCIAQAADVQTIIEAFKEDTPIENLEQYPLIVATYISPTWFASKEYDFKQAEAIAERLFDAPCTEVMAIGNFTVAKYVALKSGTPITSRPVAIRRSRLRRVISDWLQNLAFSIRFYFWKRSLPTAERNFLNGHYQK